ncbi:MAG: hypothetical protein ACYS15_13410 [Planctomycetota bacterium]
MTEVYEHNPDDHDDPTAGFTWLMGLVGALLLVVIILGLTALYFNVKAEMFQRQVVSAERLELQALRREQEALLAGPPRFIEREQQGETVTAYIIPIEQAMEIVVREANAAGGGGG